MAYRPTRTRASRVAAVERLIQPRDPVRESLEGKLAALGFTEDEKTRLAHCLHRLDCLGLKQDELVRLLEEGGLREPLATEARWADCRLSHGPGVCETCDVDVRLLDANPGMELAGIAEAIYKKLGEAEEAVDEERRRRLGLPPWRLVVAEAVSAAMHQPADLHDEAKPEEVRDIFSPNYMPFGGVDVHQVR